jgi:hypothetical protein
MQIIINNQSIALKLKVTVLNLRPLLIGRRCMDIRAAKQQSHLHRLIFRALPRLADIHSQLPQLSHMLLVNKLCVPMLCFVKNDPHDGLPGADGAVNFGVDLVD